MKFLFIAGIFVLVAMGSGTYVNDSDMHISNLTEYIGNTLTACNSCHVMGAVYESWYHGDHKNRAECSDCHIPHDPITKYVVKAESGIRDVTAVITGNVPEVIRTTENSQKIIQGNCLHCHEQTVGNIADSKRNDERYCFECHRTVAHGERGISLSPYQEGK
ncbi:cytochrome c nitrate reductase, small subunit [Candidatus Methanoperedens nitroreducens]|uniref:Cytochrome c nitrate reductase, small subunit n=1 Tax=Candidatus Methanoperedens nitratireducens TaxID=1392998 RepID=A0A062UTN1_9EURY|nr:cytochrome c nitrite reductase small subunit [Candidatus Methanoperedens nitroreducens]KCZ70396.1 cytochrome c nitrate reductase, small subunit [Candidatus Methanoperedens nitroreducens]MDJ1420834.1 cytochrome c nitrite reductase small subunit [Candidatus Methanoperedens sp.]